VNNFNVTRRHLVVYRTPEAARLRRCAAAERRPGVRLLGDVFTRPQQMLEEAGKLSMHGQGRMSLRSSKPGGRRVGLHPTERDYR